ncbi:HNH endonuclease, partial [Modestobacter sp. SYSU DS0903]
MTETAALPPPSVPPARSANVVIELHYPGSREPSPASQWPDELLAARLQGIQRQRARATAEEAELILALAGQRPSAADPAPDHPGARRAGWTAQPADGE